MNVIMLFLHISRSPEIKLHGNLASTMLSVLDKLLKISYKCQY